MPTTNVLFVCSDGSATSIMAEAILRSVAPGRFHAHSAGFRPAASAQAAVLEFLRTRRLPAEGLQPKSYRQFLEPHGPHLDFVILLCEEARAPVSDWNGDPVVACWGLDEIERDGAAHAPLSDEEILDAYWVLSRRIKIFASLPHGKATRRAIQNKVQALEAWQ